MDHSRRNSDRIESVTYSFWSYLHTTENTSNGQLNVLSNTRNDQISNYSQNFLVKIYSSCHILLTV